MGPQYSNQRVKEAVGKGRVTGNYYSEGGQVGEMSQVSPGCHDETVRVADDRGTWSCPRAARRHERGTTKMRRWIYAVILGLSGLLLGAFLAGPLSAQAAVAVAGLQPSEANITTSTG